MEIEKPDREESKHKNNFRNWQRANEHKKVWRLDRDKYKMWGLSWELIPTPKMGTSACKDFFMTWAQINSFMAYVTRMAAHIDQAAQIARKALANYNGEDVKEKNGFGAIEELAMQRQIFCEILLCRHVENYLTYISGVLYESYLQKPELLKSGEKLEIAHILEQNSINGIVRMIAERKVESLSYSSFSDLATYINTRIGLDLVENEDTLRIIDAIETRNIIVHNRCKINKRYVMRTGHSGQRIGQRVMLGIEDVEPLAMMLGVTVKEFDIQLRKKLKIKTSRFKIHPYIDDPRYARWMEDKE